MDKQPIDDGGHASRTDARVPVSLVDAIAMLPDAVAVHTFRGAGMLILGADFEKPELIEAMRAAADTLELAGPGAQSMGHGLALRDHLGFLFIATKKVEVTEEHISKALGS